MIGPEKLPGYLFLHLFENGTDTISRDKVPTVYPGATSKLYPGIDYLGLPKSDFNSQDFWNSI